MLAFAEQSSRSQSAVSSRSQSVARVRRAHCFCKATNKCVILQKLCFLFCLRKSTKGVSYLTNARSSRGFTQVCAILQSNYFLSRFIIASQPSGDGDYDLHDFDCKRQRKCYFVASKYATARRMPYQMRFWVSKGEPNMEGAKPPPTTNGSGFELLNKHVYNLRNMH